MDYQTEDGRLNMERVQDSLLDVTDGYLSNLESVDYTTGDHPLA